MRRASLGPSALLVLLAVCGAAATAPAAAGAMSAAGDVTLTVGGAGKAARGLASADVKVAAIAPATRRGRRIVLPAASIAVGKSATLVLRGGVRFETGSRTAALRSIRMRLTAKRATVSAKAGRRRLVVLTAELPGGEPRLDRAAVTATLAAARLRLTSSAAGMLRAKLGVSGLRAGALGRLGVDAGPRKGSADGKPGAGGPGGGSAPGPGMPRSGPITEPEPPPLTRPATAVDVAGVAIAWFPRDSWIRYLTSGTGAQDGIFASGGAAKQPPIETAGHPCSDVPYSGSGSFHYGFDYAPTSGWYDPPSETAAIYGQGSVRFRWQSHGIDLSVADPEIRLAPSGSRTIFRFEGSGGTDYPDQRAALTELDLAGQPTVVDNTRTYTAVRGRLTEDGQAVFAGFYPPPDDAFGCVTVSFTTS